VSESFITTNPRILSGEPIIEGTRTPVRAIVETWKLGLAPIEEIPLHMPHLSIPQVIDALSYYFHHQKEIDDYIERNRVPEELIHPSVRHLLSKE
jgi:uncharacterized protein (DUF433 family)